MGASQKGHTDTQEEKDEEEEEAGAEPQPGGGTAGAGGVGAEKMRAEAGGIWTTFGRSCCTRFVGSCASRARTANTSAWSRTGRWWLIGPGTARGSNSG